MKNLAWLMMVCVGLFAFGCAERAADEPADVDVDVITPADEMPADETPVDEYPVDETPADEAPVDEAPVDEFEVDEIDEVEIDEIEISPPAELPSEPAETP